MSRNLQFASNVSIVVAAIFTLIAYERFRNGVETRIEESNKELNDLENVEDVFGSLDPSPQNLRRTMHDSVDFAMRSALPSWIAFLAIGFAALSGVLGLFSLIAS
jgi:hypothetical protein